ncbi:MAG: molybdopterin molybdotransferase MoeA [Verrucomicrobiota bacterium]
MKKSLPSVLEVQCRILDSQKALPAEKVSLDSAFHRFLARELKAGADRPSFNRSAMDGFAIADHSPQSYRIVGETAAGERKFLPLKKGTCIKVYTGSALPQNCIAVLPQETVTLLEQSIRPGSPCEKTFIRRKGEDVQRWDRLLSPGTLLRGPELAVLAQEGMTQPSVHRRVGIAHLAMGKELVDPARKPVGGQIRDSNSILVHSLLQSPAYQLHAQQRIDDDPKAAIRFLQSAPCQKSSVLVISGGAGEGNHDWGERLIHQLGFRLFVHGVNLRPGKPLMVARRRHQTLFVLPGNPVSHWVTWELFVRPLLRVLSGSRVSLSHFPSRLKNPWSSGLDERDVWWPGRLEYQEGQAMVTPLPLQSSGDASKLCGANALIHFPPRKESFKSGEDVATIPCEI